MNPWEKTENFEGDVKVYYDNLLNHFKKFKNELFVESGTFLGNGLKCALDAGFEKCFTIEIHPHLYEKAQSRFENEIKEGKSHFIKTHTLLIDDLNCFGRPAHDRITLDQVKNKILEINPNYKFELLDAARPQNILAAYV